MGDRRDRGESELGMLRAIEQSAAKTWAEAKRESTINVEIGRLAEHLGRAGAEAMFWDLFVSGYIAAVTDLIDKVPGVLEPFKAHETTFH